MIILMFKFTELYDQIFHIKFIEVKILFQKIKPMDMIRFLII